MSAVPYNIIAGPALVYISATGVAMPAINASPGGGWTLFGRTSGGVTARFEQSIQELMADQTPVPVKAIRTEARLVIAFSMIEVTFDRLVKSLDGQTVTAGGSPTSSYFNIHPANLSDLPQFGMLVRGPSPYGNWNLQFEIPIVVTRSSPEMRFARDGRVELAMEYLAIEDPVGSVAGTYGILRAQSA